MISGLVSVVIVNYNGEAFLRECLTALEHQSLPRHQFEVIVVDNASRDGSADLIHREFPWVSWVPLAENRGFAGGNNAGFAVARGEYIALLNNDTCADSYWLEESLRAMQQATGGVAAKLVFHANPHQLNSAGLQLLPDGRGKDIGFREVDDGRYESPTSIFAGCGAALIIRREIIDRFGGFDERLFMYCEDLELAWQSRLHGWDFRYEPAALVQHVHCGSSGEWSPFFTYHLERNRVCVNARNADGFLALWTIIGFIARIARSLMRGRKSVIGAYLRAALSLIHRLPGIWMERHARRMLTMRRA